MNSDREVDLMLELFRRGFSYFIILVSLTFSSNLIAWQCGGLSDHHDLVAVVSIESEHASYQNAYNAKINRLIFRFGEKSQGFENSSLNELEVGTVITLLESKPNVREEGHKVTVIKYDSCMQKYELGSSVRLFAKEIEKGVFRSSSRWTRVLDDLVE